MLNEQVAPGHKHPVMVKQPCGFCGNNPPYMCKACNDIDDDVFEDHAGRKSIVGSVPSDFFFV